jgi:6-pyruvoyltetrahydropterin/6-carboxytetrahydropterin synthase
MLQQFYPQPATHGFKYELNKDMDFSSAHFIPDQRSNKCFNIHGHTYFVNLTIGGDELDELGFLVNFSILKKLIHGRFDHELINNVIDEIPSTEKVAGYIYRQVENCLVDLSNKPKCLQVLVRETPSSYVIYRPNEKF